MINLIHKSILTLLLLFISSPGNAKLEQPLQLIGSGIFSFDSYRQSGASNGQYEISFFLDAVHLDKNGFGIGYIHQNQGQNHNDDIVNDIMHYNAWFSSYPELLPGKVSFAINYYHGAESARGTVANNGGPGPGPGKPSPLTVTDFSDSLEIINPVLSFINYPKSFYLDIGYATSKYKTSDASVGDLDVSQWSPAIGFAFNEQFDWLQLRHYMIELSNDIRTPNIKSTSASSLRWTHWFKQESHNLLDNISVTLLTGKRLYALDHDIRKVFNLTDMQTGSLAIGANWKKNINNNFYVYTGYEQYCNISTNDNYASLFIYTGITTRW